MISISTTRLTSQITIPRFASKHDGWKYEVTELEASGLCHPHPLKVAFFTVTRSGTLRLCYMENSGWQDIKHELEGFSSSAEMITHVAFGPEKGMKLQQASNTDQQTFWQPIYSMVGFESTEYPLIGKDHLWLLSIWWQSILKQMSLPIANYYTWNSWKHKFLPCMLQAVILAVSSLDGPVWLLRPNFLQHSVNSHKKRLPAPWSRLVIILLACSHFPGVKPALLE